MDCHFCGKELDGKDCYVVSKLLLSDWDGNYWQDEDNVAEYYLCKVCNKALVHKFRELEDELGK